MITFTMTCPNEDCEEDIRVKVKQTSPDYPGDRENPPEPAEYDVEGPCTCPNCGANLESEEFFDLAVERANELSREQQVNPEGY